ncbi:MAG: hypothetical protein K9M99_04910 [Candidatus Cloacimonetes bacterium]|nr:hypothetical protein [Candidatus Cloacimonadota bacterium]
MSVGKVVRDHAYFMNQIATSLSRELSDSELQALKRALDLVVRIPSPKLLDLNISFWLIKKFYLQIYLGEDKRTDSRNERDKFERTKLVEYKERDAEYYFAGMPEDIQQGFKFEEKRIIQSVFNRAISIPTRKIVETNIRFKFKRRYYLALYLGFDRRKRRRGSASRSLDVVSFAGSMMIYLIVILLVAYFAKSVLNYNFVKDEHAFEYLIRKLGLNK